MDEISAKNTDYDPNIHDHCGKPWDQHKPDGACPLFKYEVDVKEVHDRTFEIESETELTVDELRAKANELLEAGEKGIHFEYSSTRDLDEWTVKQIQSGGDIDYL